MGDPDDPSVEGHGPNESLPGGHFWRKQTEDRAILRPESELADFSKRKGKRGNHTALLP